MSGRLFTFGCSFTRYLWPTWADIINFDLNTQYYNWGVCGIGNVSILHKMIECDLKHKFNADDTILVNWSSWTREDRLAANGEWMCGGNIFNNVNFNKSFINQYWNEHNDTVKNASAIIAANKMFNINFQSHMVDFDSYTLPGYDYLLDNLPETVIFDTTTNTRFNNTTYDAHPDISCHLNHVSTIYNSIGLTLNAATVDHFNKLQEHVVTALTQTDINMAHEDKVSFFTNLMGSDLRYDMT